jgi:hypothetical protein
MALQIVDRLIAAPPTSLSPTMICSDGGTWAAMAWQRS